MQVLQSFFLWMDNYSAHNTLAVQRMLDKYNILTPFYPPKMTPILQVCDLHINAPIKRKERSLRAQRSALMNHFKLIAQHMRPDNKRKSKFKWTTKTRGWNSEFEMFLLCSTLEETLEKQSSRMAKLAALSGRDVFQ
jgi:hypothetical protein